MSGRQPSDVPKAASTQGRQGGEPLDANADLVRDLVSANHILFDQGVLDAFGHVTVRDPHDSQHFLMCRNMAPALVSAEDIMRFRLDGTPVNAEGRKVYLERFIHGEIYKARPDVMAVVHSHSPSVVPFSVVRASPLRAICHMAAFIGMGAPVFEIRDTAGDGSSLLVTDNRLGAALARTLSDSQLVLMRGHGSTVVADGLKKVVYRAVYAEVNARTQLQASRLGTITFLSPAETHTAMEAVESQVARAWDLWQKKAELAVSQYK
jgi:HCOMODA/2-hydroxy-3-carboxy-muconic semialdehyde decarboxylase